MNILVMNGPNIDQLGHRNVKQYGQESYPSLINRIHVYAVKQGVWTTFIQSNHEGDLVDYLHKYHQKYQAIIINPGALTHTSIALRDALEPLTIPIVEVHLSAIEKREDFRQRNYIKDLACHRITGLQGDGYLKAIDYLIKEH